VSPRPWTLVIPAPTDWINANQRLHYQKKARLTAAWRAAAALYARSAGGPSFDWCTVTATPRPVGSRRRDAANQYPPNKAGIDGLTDAGVFADDNDKVITSLTINPCDPIPAVRGKLVVAQLVLTLAVT
jgi:crossover junction endodeoxyribonuclease RusA